MTLLYFLFLGCTTKSVNCDSGGYELSNSYSIYLGAQNSTTPKAISLKTVPQGSGSLMKSYTVYNSIYFYQNTPNRLALYVSTEQPTSTTLEGLSEDIDYANDLSGLGSLIGYYVLDGSGSTADPAPYEENEINNLQFQVNHLDSIRYLTYVVPAGTSALVDLWITMDHCSTNSYDNYMEQELSDDFTLEEFWSY